MGLTIKWQCVCCAEHGEYAEVSLQDGGMARLKRSAKRPETILVCRFGVDNRPIDLDGDGVPDYVEMTEAEALSLLA